MLESQWACSATEELETGTCLPAYGGQFGRREMQEFFKVNTIHCRVLKMNCILLFHFWCKECSVEKAESQVDMLGSL